MLIPPTYCITCTQTPRRRPVAERHFAEVGLSVRFVQGVYGRVWDIPGDMGLNLSHWMLWQHCLLASHAEAIILEDDCVLVDDFRQQFAAVRATLPDDWQMVFLGSLGTGALERKPVIEGLVKVDYPIGTHCYLVRDSALPILLEANQQANQPLDLQMHRTSMHLVNHYTAWPSLAGQRTYNQEWISCCRGIVEEEDDMVRLLLTPRMEGSDDGIHCGGRGNPYNRVGGLLDLIRYTRPQEVCEIGCWRGVSTEMWLRNCRRVVCVDSWDGRPQVFKDFLQRIGKYKNRWVDRCYSLQASAKYADGEFDLVYIDSDHSYEYTLAEIAAWIPKTRRWLAGHDFFPAVPGVMQAVRERFGEPMVFADSSWLVEVHPAPQDEPQQHGAADRQQ